MHTVRFFRKTASQGRAIGHESRIKIMFALRTQTMTLTEIARMLRIRKPNATKQVQRLINVGFVEGKRKGQFVYFSLTKKARRSKKLWRALEQGLL